MQNDRVKIKKIIRAVREPPLRKKYILGYNMVIVPTMDI